MADKSVSELIAATQVTPSDLFVLEQSGVAKKLTGQTLENWLLSFADGHGGIHDIKLLGSNGLADTYRITLADTSHYDFVVTNGKSIEKIEKTKTSGLVDTYTITFNDKKTSTFKVTNGAKGAKGDNAYIWIKYASMQPTSNSVSLGDVPDDWMGVYVGTASTAPTSYSSYKWYQIRGERGDTGAPASLVSSTVSYQVGDSGTVFPSGTWKANPPTVPQGKFLWTRVVLQFNTGEPVTTYSVARMGVDGSGSVASINNIGPDENGNVTVTAASLGALSTGGGMMEGELNMNGQALSGLNPPTESTHAATKEYVDDRDWFGTGESIPSKSDLNTYQTNGKYYASSESIAQTLVNRPDGMNTNFVMWVFTRTTASVKSQLMLTLHGKMYVRSSSTSAWRDWVAITTSDEIDGLTDEIKQELEANMVKTSQIVNNFTTTAEGYVADARALKTLNDRWGNFRAYSGQANPSSFDITSTWSTNQLFYMDSAGNVGLIAINNMASNYVPIIGSAITITDNAKYNITVTVPTEYANILLLCAHELSEITWFTS